MKYRGISRSQILKKINLFGKYHLKNREISGIFFVPFLEDKIKDFFTQVKNVREKPRIVFMVPYCPSVSHIVLRGNEGWYTFTEGKNRNNVFLTV